MLRHRSIGRTRNTLPTLGAHARLSRSSWSRPRPPGKRHWPAAPRRQATSRAQSQTVRRTGAGRPTNRATTQTLCNPRWGGSSLWARFPNRLCCRGRLVGLTAAGVYNHRWRAHPQRQPHHALVPGQRPERARSVGNRTLGGPAAGCRRLRPPCSALRAPLGLHRQGPGFAREGGRAAEGPVGAVSNRQAECPVGGPPRHGVHLNPGQPGPNLLWTRPHDFPARKASDPDPVGVGRRPAPERPTGASFQSLAQTRQTAHPGRRRRDGHMRRLPHCTRAS